MREFIFGTSEYTDLYENANTYVEAFHFAEWDSEGEEITCVMCPDDGTDYNLPGTREEKLSMLKKLDREKGEGK